MDKAAQAYQLAMSQQAPADPSPVPVQVSSDAVDTSIEAHKDTPMTDVVADLPGVCTYCFSL